ncbi:MAG TPA: hypothetical protein VM096_15775 [Vicinamibacterales bacterium]|nr:hypothetical protein [Vicinamibacterales bacterium]
MKSRWALGLWLLLGLVVFNVKFDWDVRAANEAFVRSQIVRHQQGLPTLTINDGFRPKVGAAAQHAAMWLAAIAAAGTAATAVASRDR